MKLSPLLSLSLMLLMPLLWIEGCSKSDHNESNRTKRQVSTDNTMTSPQNTTVPTTIPQELNLTSTQESNISTPSRFVLDDGNGTKQVLTLKEENLTIEGEDAYPITIVSLFLASSIPSQAQAYILGKVKETYKEKVSVIGIVFHPKTARLNELKTLEEESGGNYFIAKGEHNDRFIRAIIDTLPKKESLPLPMTLLYYQGAPLFTYEGAVPIEMLEHDIKTLLEGEH